MTPTSAQSHMQAALAEAEAAGARSEVPVGAVIVDAEGQVLARSGNRSRELADPTAHAEILCNPSGLCGSGVRASRRRGPLCHAGALSDVCGRDLLCACPPPLLGRGDPKGGGVEHGARIFNQPTCHHAPELYGGIEEQRAAALLRAFFALRR